MPCHEIIPGVIFEKGNGTGDWYPVDVNIEKGHEHRYLKPFALKIFRFFHFFDDYDFSVCRCSHQMAVTRRVTDRFPEERYEEYGQNKRNR